MLYGWRQVPVNISQIGEKANATRPEIEQVLLYDPHGRDDDTVDRDLFIVRRRIEKRALASNIAELYVCSLSAQTLIYKGMFLAAADRRVLSRSAATSASSPPWRSITSAIPPTRSRNGAWRSRSACSRTMARSTR